MGFWVVVCYILAALAVESGDPLMIVLFLGLAIWLHYLWATKEKRAAKRLQEQQERERLERIQRARARFYGLSFVSRAIGEMRNRGWEDLNYTKGGCKVLKDRIETPYQTYLYGDLENLDIKGCEELAVFIGEAYGGAYKYQIQEKLVGGASNSYSGHLGPDGSVSIYPDGGGDFVPIGYKLYSEASVPPPPPPKKKW